MALEPIEIPQKHLEMSLRSLSVMACWEKLSEGMEEGLREPYRSLRVSSEVPEAFPIVPLG